MPASKRWMLLISYTTTPGNPVVVSFERFMGQLTAVFEPGVVNARYIFINEQVYEDCIAEGRAQGWQLRPSSGMRPMAPYTRHERHLLAHYGTQPYHGQQVASVEEWRWVLGEWRTHYYCDGCSSHENPLLLYHCVDCYQHADLSYELCATCYARRSRGEHRQHRFVRGDSQRFSRMVHRYRLTEYPGEPPTTHVDNDPPVEPVVAVDESCNGGGFSLFD